MISVVAGACMPQGWCKWGCLHACGGDGEVVATIVLLWFELNI